MDILYMPYSLRCFITLLDASFLFEQGKHLDRGGCVNLAGIKEWPEKDCGKTARWIVIWRMLWRT